jgi:hypothetical protein
VEAADAEGREARGDARRVLVVHGRRVVAPLREADGASAEEIDRRDQLERRARSH